MSNINSILIVLDSSLNIYTHDNTSQTISKVFTLKPNNTSEKFLNLAEKMESIWKSNNQFWENPQTEVYYILGPLASFTDSRILYIWLKSRKLFGGGGFYTHTASVILNFETFSFVEISDYLLPIKQANSQDLLYSNEPRIGKNYYKKTF